LEDDCRALAVNSNLAIMAALKEQIKVLEQAGDQGAGPSAPGVSETVQKLTY